MKKRILNILIIGFLMVMTITAISAQGIKIRYQCETSLSTAQDIKFNFIIYNESEVSVDLSNLTLRYYRTNERGVEAVRIYWAQIGKSNITGTAYSDYIEYSFSGSAGSIPAGGNSGAINTGIHHTDWSNIDQSNDYSFDSTKQNFTDWENITLYKNKTRIWGTEPCDTDSNPTPAPTTSSQTPHPIVSSAQN